RSYRTGRSTRTRSIWINRTSCAGRMMIRYFSGIVVNVFWYGPTVSNTTIATSTYGATTHHTITGCTAAKNWLVTTTATATSISSSATTAAIAATAITTTTTSISISITTTATAGIAAATT